MSSAKGRDELADAVIDRPGSSSGVLRLLILGLVLIAAAIALYAYGRDRLEEPLVLAVLGGFAGMGVFFLFALVLGLVRLSSQNRAETFSRSLVNSMESGVVVSDAQGRIVYANRAYAELLGAEDESQIASIETAFSRRMEASEIVYRMNQVAADGHSAVEEFRVASGLGRNGDGARWYRLRVKPMKHEAYSKPLTVWQLSDITADRRRQESTFRELQNAIHYLDHAPAGFMATETNGEIAYLNATLADWLGIDLAEFKPDALKLGDLVIGDGMALLDATNSDTDKPGARIVDLDLARSNGKPLPVRLYHRVSSATDGAPGPARTIVLNRLQDGADEAVLRDAEIRFTRFFNNSPAAIASVNSKGEILRTNGPFLRMFADAIKAGGGIEKMVYGDLANENERAALEKAVEAALSGNAQIDPVDIGIRGEGERFVRFFASGVSGDDEPETGEAGSQEADRAIIYALDMTEQRALEEQFAQGQKMQAVGQLAGGVAHDFNNVLTAIIGFSDLLLANHRPSDPSFQDIMNIKQNANRAASLVRQLLAFSRRQTLRPQVLQLGDVLSDLRMLLDRLLGEKVDLKVVHGRDVWPVRADISQFEQVVVNLAVNARDAMPEGGKLEIRTSNVSADEVATLGYKEMPQEDFVLLEVEDHGTGMSEEVLEKIFEPFFSTKDVGKGTGLGLSTVYGIVKQTGGYIYPVSEVGSGTTFRVFLPRHVEQVAVEEEEKPEGNSVTAVERPKDLTGNARILLVEDEDAVRAFASRALMSRGYEVVEASSGIEALEEMSENEGAFDLVVSDVVMPEMDGPTLFTELRKDHPELKFVFMSGYAEEAFAKNLPNSERETFGFLPKPFSLKQLAETVKETLEA